MYMKCFNTFIKAPKDTVFQCDVCEEFVYDGEPYWEINGERWCEACIDDAKKYADKYED